MKYIYFFFFFSFLSIGPLQAYNSGEVRAVDNLNIERFLGTWYEVARLPQFFQRKCYNSVAKYELREDGDIKVINKCNWGSENGKIRTAIGRAWVADDNTNGKLKVQFFLRRFRLPWVSGDYWVLHINDNYTQMLVGEPTRKNLWILTKEKEMSESDIEYLKEIALDQGYDLDNLISQ